MRAKGVVVTLPDKEPRGVLADEAKKIQKRRQERKIISKPRPVPNWKCYPMIFVVGKNIGANGNWLGRGRLPRCLRCDGVLSPRENHVCPGYTPKYPEFDKELRQQQREKVRELIHEGYYESRSHEEAYDSLSDQEYQDAYESRIVECRDCGEELHGIEDGMSHDCLAKDIDSD